MAKTVYVDGTAGDNGNDGLTLLTAKETIAGARAATTAGDLVLISPGVYLEPDTTWNAGTDADTVYMHNPDLPGLVIVDFEALPGIHWQIGTTVSFRHIMFVNPPAGNVAIACFANNAKGHFKHCVFATMDGSNTGWGLGQTFASCVNVENCTFWGLEFGIVNMFDANTSSYIYGNYFENVTTAFVPTPNASIPRDFNAYPGSVEANGIDTNTINPGLRDPSNFDFRLDNTTDPADWASFMSGGRSGGRIGAYGQNGISYESDVPQLRFLSPTTNASPYPEWENEGPSGTGTYTDGTPGDIIEEISTKALVIDLATTPAATGGRVRSPVFDLGATTSEIVSAAFKAYQNLVLGAALDTNNTLPQQYEWRASNTLFAIGDVSPSWNAANLAVDLSQTFQYFQIRITFRTDHTNT